jgi:hypothetical protein
MTTRKRTRKALLIPAALLFAAPAVWLIFQQGTGTIVYLDCGSAGPPAGPALGLGATLLCLAAAHLAWRRRTRGSETQRFVMRIGLGSALIFALAALVMTAALIVVPPCAR